MKAHPEVKTYEFFKKFRAPLQVLNLEALIVHYVPKHDYSPDYNDVLADMFPEYYKNGDAVGMERGY